jgi:protoporphyrinogen oxidase
LQASLGIKTEGYKHQLYFHYPRVNGIQAVTDVLEENINDHVVTGFEVQKLRKEGSQWMVSDGRQEKIYNELVSTIPIHHLIQALGAPKQVKQVVAHLKFNSIITIMIGLKVPKLNRLSWLYIPDKTVLTHRVSFPSNFSPKVAPSGMSSVLAEITCPPDGDLWKRSDERIAEQTVAELHALKVLDKATVCFVKVARQKYAYVISDTEYRENLAVIRRFTDEVGVTLLGRFSEFKYLNMDACVERAWNFVTTRGLKQT